MLSLSWKKEKKRREREGEAPDSYKPGSLTSLLGKILKLLGEITNLGFNIISMLMILTYTSFDLRRAKCNFQDSISQLIDCVHVNEEESCLTQSYHMFNGPCRSVGISSCPLMGYHFSLQDWNAILGFPGFTILAWRAVVSWGKENLCTTIWCTNCTLS